MDLVSLCIILQSHHFSVSSYRVDVVVVVVAFFVFR